MLLAVRPDGIFARCVYVYVQKGHSASKGGGNHIDRVRFLEKETL